jgi:hypothetical protein
VTTTPVSRVLQEAAYARDVAERAIRYAESTSRIYHGLYERHRETIAKLERRLEAAESRLARLEAAGAP